MSHPAWAATSTVTSAGTSDAAPDPASAPLQVDVIGQVSDRDQRDYHDALEGIEAFNKFHSLAPQAELHFKLYPRSETLKPDGVKLHLKSDSVQRDITLGPDWVFDIPNDATADKESGALVTNRPDKSFAWRPDIRTPGLAPNVRRLGDLRLECKVDIAARFAVIPPMPANLALLASGADVCNMSIVHWDFISDRPIFGITLANKENRLPLQTAIWLYANRVVLVARPMVDFMLLDDRVYELPLADAKWPDDTLVEFDYMDDALPPAPTGPLHANATTQTSTIN